jgi:hypothetical protein
MAKRSRGSTRPGQRRPSQRSRQAAQRQASQRPPQNAAPAPARSTGLTAAEEERAAEIEAGLVEQERSTESTGRRSRERSQAGPDVASRGRARGSLAERYADEYAYVRRDLRQIFALAAVLLIILFGLYFVIDVAGIIKI